MIYHALEVIEMNFKGTPYLESSRLILRKFSIDDAKYMFENWASSETVTKYLTWNPHESVEKTKLYLEYLDEQYKNPQVLNWCIQLKEIDLPIGGIDARLISEPLKSFDIGYSIGEKWWNKGIATEALKMVIKYLFTDLKANRIEAYHDIRNMASGRVMQKCGMMFEGILREAKMARCGAVDVCLYSILKRDLETFKQFC